MKKNLKKISLLMLLASSPAALMSNKGVPTLKSAAKGTSTEKTGNETGTKVVSTGEKSMAQRASDGMKAIADSASTLLAKSVGYEHVDNVATGSKTGWTFDNSKTARSISDAFGYQFDTTKDYKSLDAQTKVDKAKAKVAKATDKVTAAEAELARNKELIANKSSNNWLIKRLDEGILGNATKQVAAANAKVQKAEAKVTKAEAELKLTPKDAQVNDAQTKVKDAQTKVSEAQAQVNDAQTKLTKNSKDIDAQNELSNAQNELSNAQNELSYAQSKLDKALAIQDNKWNFSTLAKKFDNNRLLQQYQDTPGTITKLDANGNGTVTTIDTQLNRTISYRIGNNEVAIEVRNVKEGTTESLKNSKGEDILYSAALTPEADQMKIAKDAAAASTTEGTFTYPNETQPVALSSGTESIYQKVTNAPGALYTTATGRQGNLLSSNLPNTAKAIGKAAIYTPVAAGKGVIKTGQVAIGGVRDVFSTASSAGTAAWNAAWNAPNLSLRDIIGHNKPVAKPAATEVAGKNTVVASTEIMPEAPVAAKPTASGAGASGNAVGNETNVSSSSSQITNSSKSSEVAGATEAPVAATEVTGDAAEAPVEVTGATEAPAVGNESSSSQITNSSKSSEVMGEAPVAATEVTGDAAAAVNKFVTFDLRAKLLAKANADPKPFPS